MLITFARTLRRVAARAVYVGVRPKPIRYRDEPNMKDSKMKNAKRLLLLLIIVVESSATAWAEKTTYLSAEESDPRVLQWMVGSPPPSEKLIMQPQSNYFSFPKLRWTVCHIREFLPTKQVSRGLGAAIPFNYVLDKGIDSIKFKPTGSNREITWKRSLSSNYTDGILILHKGKIVYEQ